MLDKRTEALEQDDQRRAEREERRLREREERHEQREQRRAARKREREAEEAERRAQADREEAQRSPAQRFFRDVRRAFLFYEGGSSDESGEEVGGAGRFEIGPAGAGERDEPAVGEIATEPTAEEPIGGSSKGVTSKSLVVLERDVRRWSRVRDRLVAMVVEKFDDERDLNAKRVAISQFRRARHQARRKSPVLKELIRTLKEKYDAVAGEEQRRTRGEGRRGSSSASSAK